MVLSSVGNAIIVIAGDRWSRSNKKYKEALEKGILIMPESWFVVCFCLLRICETKKKN